MQAIFDFSPKAQWTAAPVSTMPSWRDAKRVSIDLETWDPTLKELGPGPRRFGVIVGIAFAIEDGPAHYLPILHSGGNLNVTHVLQYLKDQAAVFKGEIVGANLSYDLDFLNCAGIWFGNARFRDVLIADPLICELHPSYSLQSVATRWGFDGKNEIALRQAALLRGIDPKSSMNQLPAHAVAEYAICDAMLPLQILRKQEKAIESQDLRGVFDMESDLLPVLVKMRHRGVKISEKRLDEIDGWALEQEAEACRFIRDKTSVPIGVGDVWQPIIIGRVLDKIGIPDPASYDKETLTELDHPVTDNLVWARKVNKLRTTFVESIKNHMTNGRIHCVFNQLAREDDSGKGIKGARWGRMSSEHPNLQQQPARDEFSARWRSIYMPDGEGLWASADYSQQEPRMVTHYAVSAKCSRAEDAAKRYREDPKCDNHQMMADLTGLPRKQAKNIYLGLCYGMGGGKLAASLGLPVVPKSTASGKRYMAAGPEAQAILDKFNAQAPFVKELAERCRDLAQTRGYVKTLSGRRCRFPVGPEGKFDFCQNAMNRLVQGSAADQTKMAMVAADKAGYRLQLQVHDELDLTVETREEAERLAVIMRECVELSVPSRVDVEMGASWGEAA